MGRLQLSAVLLWAIICYVSGQGVLSPNDPYPRGSSNLPVPSDPDSSLSLSPEENLAMRDLYNSLIKGSSAESIHHGDWFSWVTGSGLNPCGLKGTNHWVLNNPYAAEDRKS